MESLQPQTSSLAATRQRTSIPLRSILNVEEVRDSAEQLQPRPPPSETVAFTANKPVAQRSQFLFINTHDTSSPYPRLRHDQKVINAHVQHASHRKRRAAALDRLKHTLRLCVQCAQSRPRGPVTAPERSSSPSSSASESSPASTNVSDALVRQPSQRVSHKNDVCSQCGTDLPTTGGSHSDHDVRKKIVETVFPITTVLASAKEKAPRLTLFVEDQPTSFLDTCMMDPFATSSVSMNMEMNGVMLHCGSPSIVYSCTSLRGRV
jgi:hypothetical protein